MERATPAHTERGRSQGVWVRLARLIWSGIVNRLRPEARSTATAIAGRRELPAGGAPPPPLDAPAAARAADRSPAAAATTPPPPAPDPAPPAPADAELEVGAAIMAATAALDLRSGLQAPLISIVTVITAWTAGVTAALDSLRRQSYPLWELVVVDTADPAGPPRLVAEGDGRIRVLSAAGVATAAGYDRALEASRGQLVACLGEGASMAPGWLRALAWAYGEWPGASTFIGARLSLSAGAVADPAADLVRLLLEGRARLGPDDGAPDAVALRPERGGTVTGEARDDRWGRLGVGPPDGTERRVPALATLCGASPPRTTP